MSKWIAEFDLEDGDTMPEHMDLEYKGARIDFHCRPQEPFKPMVEIDLDYVIKQKYIEREVLDKIRAEIETKYGQCKLTEYIVQYDGICTSANDIGDIADILQIIDKYKAESEAADGNVD